jgi:hypothetical protein
MARFGKRGKLNRATLDPSKILARIGPVTYKLKLPQELQNVHDTFHVSNRKKCLTDANLIIPIGGSPSQRETQLCGGTSWDNGSGSQTVETKSNPDREDSMERQARTRVYLGARGPNEKKYPHLFAVTKEAPTS